MSIHSSLRGVDNLVGQRSVLSRVERIQKLEKSGKFDTESDSVYGLPKVRTKFKTISAKQKAKADDETVTEGENKEGGETKAEE